MWKYKHYRNTFLIATISACLPAAIIGLFVYIFGTANIEAEAKRTHQNQVSFATERIDSNLAHLETVIAQWSFNLNLSNTYGNLDVEKDFYNIQQVIFKSLTWIKSSDPLIEEVSLYLDKQEVLITENKGILKFDSQDTLKLYRSLIAYQRDIFWTDTITNNKHAAPYMLVMRLPGGLVKTEAALIVEINSKQLNRLIGELDPGGEGSALLMQQDGNYISFGRDGAAGPSELDVFVTDAVKGQGQDRGSVIETWQGQTFSISFGKMKRIGHIWTVATATPIEQMTKPVKLLSHVVIYAGAAGLLFALGLSWLASRQLYRPIRRLAALLRPGGKPGFEGTDEIDYIASEWNNLSRESQTLQERLDTHLPSLRESFLLQLVQGHLYFLNDAEITRRMEEYGWEVQDKLHAAIVLQLHGLYSSEGRFSSGDEQLVTFAAFNIVEELVKSKALDANVINFQDLTVGLLVRLHRDTAMEDVKSVLYHLAGELAATLHNLLKVHTTVCVGKTAGSLSHIPAMFDDTRKALSHKKLNEQQQILYMDEMMPEGQHQIMYPLEAEKEIIQALRMGMEAELYKGMDEFLSTLQRQSDKEIQVRHGLLQLYGNLQNAIMLSGFSPLQIVGGEMLWEELLHLQDPNAVLQSIKNNLVRPYIRVLHVTQDIQLKQLVEKVLITIHEQYMKDISLEYCADLHGTYPKKLSLGFKQVTDKTFIDYLTKYRLDKAKQLLLETDEKINDIAVRVGYQPPYFNRIFKKNEGMTPGQFREKGGSAD
ncbi:helix-turn-helix domain-containing protein [Paenibacillus sp. NPDC056579]|uniref:helix-turn-helix domain-containing protein n=1 Tax=unclassified Paenibacillus TaxID=185978 RepID=UPI001EF8B54A|nr:helix-turn-helix domain-containing protein [Paenibacillus sp. H1-7]ULL19082.1 AraC family transcriptional regulator [Paenibacillus sp. H1-7]